MTKPTTNNPNSDFAKLVAELYAERVLRAAERGEVSQVELNEIFLVIKD
jgi:hypothetical protein